MFIAVEYRPNNANVIRPILGLLVDIFNNKLVVKAINQAVSGGGITTLNKNLEAQLLLRSQEPIVYDVVWNNRAACRLWLFQTWKFGRFFLCQMVSFTRQMAPTSMVQEVGSLRGQSRCTGLIESCKTTFLGCGALPIHLFKHFCWSRCMVQLQCTASSYRH